MYFDEDNFPNEVDIEMAYLERQGRKASRLAKQGICVHSWLGPVSPGSVEYKCFHCGKEFPNVDAAHDEYDKLMH
jgi:hypothetical protein